MPEINCTALRNYTVVLSEKVHRHSYSIVYAFKAAQGQADPHSHNLTARNHSQRVGGMEPTQPQSTESKVARHCADDKQRQQACEAARNIGTLL